MHETFTADGDREDFTWCPLNSGRIPPALSLRSPHPPHAPLLCFFLFYFYINTHNNTFAKMHSLE